MISAILQKNTKDFSLLIYRYISSRRDWEKISQLSYIYFNPTN